jgi:Flp pilus assembly protein TadG
MVELAIVLPVLCLLLATTAEFGRFFHTYTTLTKATRSAARFLTTAPGNGTDDDKAKNLVVYGNTEGDGDPVLRGLSTANVLITREGGATGAGMPEKVTVTIDGYTYQPLFNPGAFLNDDRASLQIEVSPHTTMRFLSSLPSS